MKAPLTSLIERLPGARILVVGDAMLDIYSTATSNRLSPEAPVPVALIEESRIALGGAANVAANIAALGAQVDFLCLTGADAGRAQMMDLIEAAGMSAKGLIAEASRPTIVKERVSVNGTPFMRIDREQTQAIGAGARDDLMTLYKSALPQVGAVILSDYCKGTLPEDLAAEMIALAQEKNIPVLVDSKKLDFTCFAGALAIKPNAGELATRTGMDTGTAHGVIDAARALIKKSGVQSVLASRSEHGVILVRDTAAQEFDATARQVREVSGAGDTLLSVCAAVVAVGGDLAMAACLGNIAAGVAVEGDGTSHISNEALRDAVLRYDDRTIKTA